MFLRGVLIGLSIAAPVGPMGVLCIRRTLADGRWVGLATGLGVATADATYGAVAGFGITVISTVLLSHQAWIRVIGGLFLWYLGLKTFIARPADRDATADGHSLRRAYTSAVGLTLANPTTILSFAAIFAGVGVTAGGRASAALLVFGVFIGSALWWLLLCNTVATVRTKVVERHMRWINRLSGCSLAGFGLLAFVSLYRP
jgi:threonine/homoserine/homoserine lactone efflux protein